jgi:hypothetical protein
MSMVSQAEIDTMTRPWQTQATSTHLLDRKFIAACGCMVAWERDGYQHRWLVASECVKMGNLQPQPEPNPSDGGGGRGVRTYN